MTFLKTAEKICKTCLDITPEWLLWGEEFPVNNRMINWLKKHEDERKQIAERGQATAARKLSYEKLMGDILREYE